jgi:hypothetical protein
MDAGFKLDSKVLQTMLCQAVLRVTGRNKIQKAWADLVKPDDIVGLVPTPHLNPTHPELVDVVKVSLMKELGIPDKNIIMAQGARRRPEKCTALISMPALKGHWLTGIGTAIKNYIIYSGRPSSYHEEKSAKLGEIWPISPPPICVEAADKVYGLGASKMEEIKIVHFGWEEDLLLG